MNNIKNCENPPRERDRSLPDEKEEKMCGASYHTTRAWPGIVIKSASSAGQRLQHISNAQSRISVSISKQCIMDILCIFIHQDQNQREWRKGERNIIVCSWAHHDRVMITKTDYFSLLLMPAQGRTPSAQINESIRIGCLDFGRTRKERKKRGKKGRPGGKGRTSHVTNWSICA